MKRAAAFAAAALMLSACAPGEDPSPSMTSSTAAGSTTTTTTAPPLRDPVPAGPLAVPAHGYTPVPVPVPASPPDRVLTLPQIRGGEPAVTDRFNSALRASLAGMPQPSPAMSVEDGELSGGYRSGITRIGSGAVAGRLVVSGYRKGAAHPNDSLGTVVVATANARPVTVDDLYRDRAAVSARMRTLLPEFDVSNRLRGRDLHDDGLLENWLPRSAGLEIYVGVPHVVGDFVPVLVPWDRIADLLRPGVLEMLRAD